MTTNKKITKVSFSKTDGTYRTPRDQSYFNTQDGFSWNLCKPGDLIFLEDCDTVQAPVGVFVGLIGGNAERPLITLVTKIKDSNPLCETEMHSVADCARDYWMCEYVYGRL